jgi:hypothetical protein
MATIYVCSNNETLADGHLNDYQRGSWQAETLVDIVSEACWMISDAGHEAETSCIFQDWNGGKHYKAGGLVGDTKWGYSAGFVVTHERNPSSELIALIERVDDYIRDKLAEASEQEDSEAEEEV